MSGQIPVIVKNDPWLSPYKDVILRRNEAAKHKEQSLCQGKRLQDFATGHLYFGLHKENSTWVFREWAPNATEIFLIGDFSDWKVDEKYRLHKISFGNWEVKLPLNSLLHQQRYKLLVRWNGGEAYRLPAWGTRMVQDKFSLVFDAQVWDPVEPYNWKNQDFKLHFKTPVVYEAHVGMATTEEKVGSYNEFRNNVLPKIKKLGYNVIQLMAVQEHPYYGSFGYHVSNFLLHLQGLVHRKN
jgi:1,4-alpha-glucan branching enzyme